MGFFKAYDMRGTFGADFDLGTVFRVGKALPQVVGGRRWLVGRDCRETSAAMRDALVRGLAAAGADVTDLGLVSTPMVYFFTSEGDFDGSVMITASHNPPGDNGLKVSMKTSLPVGYANGLAEVERLVKAQGDGKPCEAEGPLPQVNRLSEALGSYLDWMRAHAPDFSGLKFAVDCSNGMASIWAREMFPGAVVFNDTLDGRFPNHSPNPLKAEARAALAACVCERGLDCGVIFDGDADRCMFVDERGEFVQPDYLIPVVAKATLKAMATERPGKPRIIHDVRTSRGAIEALAELGCESVMVPVGHAFAKPILRKVGAVCGGELAGHYYFSEFHGCDSGLLAALRILGEIAAAKRSGQPFSRMMRAISGRYANSGELNFEVAQKDEAIARLLACAARELPPETGRSAMDGIRVEFADGWFNVRKSNTEPYLRLIVECREAARLAEWVKAMEKTVLCHQG